MTVYEYVKMLVDQAGLSIAELEKQCGLGNGTIRSWEKSMPRIDKIYPIALFFNVSIEYFLNGIKINYDFTEDEKRLIAAYRDQSEEGKKIIRRSLGIEEPTNREVDSNPKTELQIDVSKAFTKTTT